MSGRTSSESVRLDLLLRREIALLDVREEAPYAAAHPLFAASLPLSRLELDVFERVPRRDTRLVVYDDGHGLAAQAAERLEQLGYTQVSTLAGGLAAWRAAGFEVFRDVNSASKAFGELVEARRHTPSIPAPEALALIESGADLAILDARRFEEYQTMSIPRGVSVPGAELVLRAREIAPDPDTTIVVNCAGRTRSIIGAQSLINAGVPNRVMALRDGTIGWSLAGQALEHGRDRRGPDATGPRVAAARAAARDVAYRSGVRELSRADAETLAADLSRTLYRLDVRPPQEYVRGHLPGFRNAPGGQLVQETDVWAPVRGARILLADDLGVRADMTASWLAQMGWDVHVLAWRGEGRLEIGLPQPTRPRPPAVPLLDAAGLEDELASGRATLIDLAPSAEYRRGHIPGAWFAIRSVLPAALAAVPSGRPLVLTSPDGLAAAFAAPEAAALTGQAVRVLEEGTGGWTASGRGLQTGEDRMASAPDDLYRRPYEGADNPRSAMQAYLDWEAGLVAQLQRDASHGFFVT